MTDRPKRDCQCPRTKHRHGTAQAYDRDRCRCRPCTDASNARKRDIRKHPNPQVPAESAWALLDELRQLHTLHQIADLSGLTYACVIAISCRQQSMVRTETLDALRSVPMSAVTRNEVDSTGAVRRARALAAAGHSPRDIAAASGLAQRTVADLMMARFSRISRATDEGMKTAYSALWSAPSASKISAARMIRRAEAEGWAPPLAWDDEALDDPRATPAPGWRRNTTTGHAAKATDEAQWRLELGESVTVVARDLGVEADYLAQKLRRAA